MIEARTQPQVNALDAARALVNKRFAVLPVPHKQKGPTTAGWQHLRISESELTKYFNGQPANIGILTGEPSGWLVDIDLDHPQAVALAHDYLPGTEARFGRDSKPESHWLYRVTRPIATRKFQSQTRTMIVEIRADGCQTIAPGSVHPNGEAVRWDADGEPAEIDPDELIAAVERLACDVGEMIGEPLREIRPEQPPAVVPHQRTDDRREERCWRYITKTPDAISGQGGHDCTFRAACETVRFDLDTAARWRIMRRFNAEKCRPMWSDGDLAHKLADAEREAGHERGIRLVDQSDFAINTVTWDRPTAPEYAARNGEAMVVVANGEPELPKPTFTTAGQLIEDNPELRPPVVHGLLREGEVGNLISAPKTHKTHTAMALSLAVVTGTHWLGFETEQGDALYLDAELHPQTFANRLPKVASALGLNRQQWDDRLIVDTMRGRLTNIFSLGPYFRAIEPGRFKLVVIDSLYRFWPRDANENDNACITAVYNALDEYAQHLRAAFVVIHHASKGAQSDKAITDVGSGAGAQSRAADAHIVLRQHEEDDAVVMDAVVRSWPPVEPRCLRWNYPCWKLAIDLNPDDLRKTGRRRRDKPVVNEPKPDPWTVERFARSFITSEPVDKKIIVQKARTAGITNRDIDGFIAVGTHDGLIHTWSYPKDRRVLLANRPQTVCETTRDNGSKTGVEEHSHTHTPPHTPRVDENVPRGGVSRASGNDEWEGIPI